MEVQLIHYAQIRKTYYKGKIKGKIYLIKQVKFALCAYSLSHVNHFTFYTYRYL